MPTQCVKSLNQQSTRSNCCWIMNMSSETDCLSSKNWHSPTDSLRCVILLHPNFLYKNLKCQNEGKGQGQAWCGKHLIFSVKCTLFGHGYHTTLNVYRMVQRTILPPSHFSWHCYLHCSSRYLLDSNPMQSVSWNGLVWCTCESTNIIQKLFFIATYQI